MRLAIPCVTACRIPTARRSLEHERTRPGSEAGAARLLEEPGLRGHRDPHARARQRGQHGDLHPARPGDAALAARRAARPPGGALRPRPVLRVVQQPERHGDADVPADARRPARPDTRVPGRLRALRDSDPLLGEGPDGERQRRHGLRHVLRGAGAAPRARASAHARGRQDPLGAPRRRAGSRLLRAPLRRRRERRRPDGDREQPPHDGRRCCPARVERRRRGLRGRRVRAARDAAGGPAHLGQAPRRLARALARMHGPTEGRRRGPRGEGRRERGLRAAPPGGPGAPAQRVREPADPLPQEDAGGLAWRARHLGPARPVGHAARRADGHGRPRAPDRLRQRGEPAPDARLVAPEGDRGAAGPRCRPPAPDAPAPRGEPRAVARGRARRPAARLLGGGGAHPRAALPGRDPDALGRARLACWPLHPRALRAHRCRLRARARPAGQPGRPRPHAQERRHVGRRRHRALPTAQRARRGAGRPVAAPPDRRRALHPQPDEPAWDRPGLPARAPLRVLRRPVPERPGLHAARGHAAAHPGRASRPNPASPRPPRRRWRS